jgi:hypothetical protein
MGWSARKLIELHHTGGDDSLNESVFHATVNVKVNTSRGGAHLLLKLPRLHTIFRLSSGQLLITVRGGARELT